MADISIIKPPADIPKPGTEEYARWAEEQKKKPPFLMPEGPYKQTGAQNWYIPASRVVKTPKTEMVEVRHDLTCLLDGILPEGYKELIDELDAKVQMVGGYPVFFRSGQTSAKHFSWEACIAKDKDDLSRVILELLNRSYIGFPDQSHRWLMVRELIQTQPVFNAYFPITKEFRFFIEHGQISHIQPYWPEEAMKDHHGQEPNDPDWRQKLFDISKLTIKEKEFLEEETLKIARTCPGDWSVDWLQDKFGDWWMIDMAAACVSYRYKPTFDLVIDEEESPSP